ncbi:5117_t:CDS:10, partial [Entrophospora sp. SA101]
MSSQNVENPEVIMKEEINRVMEDVDTTVHEFDPDAPPEVKAKQVQESSGVDPAAASSSKTTGVIEGDTTSANLPGALPHLAVESASEIPEWARIGWKNIVELDSKAPEKVFYDEILGEMYFGQLWLNAAVVFVAVFSTYFVTLFGGGLGWVLIICAFVATYFRNSVRRFHRNARSDIARELAKEKLETDSETTEWINEFLHRFWMIYEPVLSATIVQIADGILLSSTPSFLDSIRLTTFTLGSKAPIIESVKSYPNAEDDIVIMDWRVSFVPNDIANMTRAQLIKKVNPKIILTIRVGRGMVGAGLPVLLEDISFSGLMRIKLKLMNTFPHVKTIGLSFLEEPKIDYVLKPIGGETFGFDIANIPGLSDFIRNQIHANLRPMMYDPNVFVLDAESLVGGYPIETAIGVLELKIISAKKLRNVERFGTSDPYVKLTILGQAELGRTKVIDDSLDPVWDETHYLVLKTLSEVLKFEIYDANEFTADKLLGIATFSLNSLIDNPEQNQVTAQVLFEGKQYGEILFNVRWYPVAVAKEGEPVPDSTKDLNPNLSLVGQYNPYAELLLNDKPIFRSKTLKRTNNPIWEEPTELFVTNRKGAQISVIVRDSRDFSVDPIVGSYKCKLGTILEATSDNDWFKVQDAPPGKLRLSCQWKPVLIENPHVAIDAEPIGIVKLQIKKAEDLKISGKFNVNEDKYEAEGVFDTSKTINDELGGTIYYSASFHPIIPLNNVTITETEKKVDLAEQTERVEVVENTNVLNYTSGILTIKFVQANIEKKDISLELYVDNDEFPVYNTSRSRSSNPCWNEVAKIFVKELGYSRIRLYVKSGEGKRPIGTIVHDIKKLIENSQSSTDGSWLKAPELENAQFNISVNYLPVKYELDPSESLKNMGRLSITINSAKILEEVCKSGSIDAYLFFILNGEKIFKSKTIKQSLNPVFDEKFEAKIVTNFELEVIDWNQIAADEKLAVGKIPIDDLEPTKLTEKEIPITSIKDPKISYGTVYLELLFTPDFLDKETRQRGPINGAKRTLSGIGSTAISGGDKILNAGSSIVGTVGSGIGSVGGFFNKRNSGGIDPHKNGEVTSGSINPELNGSRKNSTKSVNQSEENIGIPGTLTLSIPEAKELLPTNKSGLSDPYFKVKIDKKQIFKSDVIKKNLSPQWKSSKVQIPNITGGPITLHIFVKKHHLVGKDEDIGEYDLNLWEHIKPGAFTEDTWVNLTKVNR